MRKRIICAALLALAVPCAGRAEEPYAGEKTAIEYVVTANRIETPIDEVATSTTVIEAEEIKERGIVEVYEALRSVPGVDVVRSGGMGGNTAIFMRGANSEHTLVLIDGVAVNNPISNARFFNFADLSTENIERIEVLRGPQSTLYGSDALGGVINIITKRGSGPATASAGFEGGSFSTFTERGAVSGGTDLVNYSLGTVHQESAGYSSADERLGNQERDGFNNLGLSGRLGLTPHESTDLSLIVRYQGSTSDLDNFGGPGGDDLDRALKNQEFVTRGQAAFKLLDGSVRPTFGAAYVHEQFKDDSDPDFPGGDLLRSTYTGSRLKFDFQNEWDAAEWLTALVGAETQEERGDSYYHSDGAFGPYDNRFPEESVRNNGYFLQLQGKFSDTFFPVAGLRVDTNTGFDSEVTWRVGPTVLIRETGTKLFSTVGTGYKAPSLYQRYSEYGDENLVPETSLGVDAGVEQQIVEDLLSAGITYFHNDFDHLITFDPNTFKFENINKATTDGLESFIEIRPLEELTARVNYTLTNTKDESTGDELLRRPQNKVSAMVRYAFCERGSVRADILYVGQRLDNDYSTYPATPVELGGYTTVNLAGNYEIFDGIDLTARIENLFDRSYQEVYGFGTGGIAAFGGVRVTL